MLTLKELGERPGFMPGFLSFCLPGMGQLYQRRYRAAAAGILPFWFLLAVLPGHAWPLLLAFAFGGEAFYWGSSRPAIEASTEGLRRRRNAYVVTAIVAFCFWAMLVSPAALPLRRQGMANAVADKLAGFYQACARQRGSPPANAADCGAEARRPTDPWGGSFDYVLTERGFELRSAGADGKWATPDDFIYRYRFR